MTDTIIKWIGIIICISQAGMLSGLNLSMLGVSRLKLEVQANTGNKNAAKLLDLRKDINFLLATIVWGNVGANVLLTLLSDSVLAGMSAFVFSTFVITFGGEILPQAYFSRHALKIANLLAPMLRFYQIILYPIARPTGLVLDAWFGKEAVKYYSEKDIREIIHQHAVSDESDVNQLEGRGALNFLAFDDLRVSQEGQTIDPKSIIALPAENGRVQFPAFERNAEDPFIRKIQASGKHWAIITSLDDKPMLALDTRGFLRAALFSKSNFDPFKYCHYPLVVHHLNTPLGEVISKLKVNPEKPGDDVIDHDIILIWARKKRIITGADILGRLLRGIVKNT